MHSYLKPLAALLPFIFIAPSHAVEQLAALDPILITATRTATRTDEVLSDVTVVTEAEIRNAPQTNLPEFLGTLPGVQFTSNGGLGASGTLSLRGANSEHSVILIDGLRVSSATLGTTAIEHIPMSQVERIEVVRGPVSSLYGADAIGGVIQIFTRRGSGTPAPYFSLGFGRYNTSEITAGYGGQIGNTRFNINAGFEDSDALSTYRNPVGGGFDPYNSDRDPYRNLNFNTQVSHALSDTLEVGAQALHITARKHFDSANCDAAYNCTANYDNRSRQVLEAYSGHVRFKPSSFWISEIRLGQSRDSQQSWRLDPSLPAEIVDRYQTTQEQASWENHLSLGRWGKLLAALDWRNERISSTQPLTTTSRRSSAVIGGYQGSFGSNSVQLSLRRDDITGFDPRTSSSFAYGYQLSDQLRARFALGRAFHVPTFNQLYWPVDPANYFQGNPNLKVERAFNRELGLNYERGGTKAGVTYFYNKVSDLLNYVSPSSFPYIGQYENVGQATLKGGSITASQTLGNWTFSGIYNYLNAKDDVSGRYLQRRIPHTGQFTVDYRAGRLTTGVQLQAYSDHFNNNTNSQHLGGYALINLYANWQLEGAWSAFAKINNLLDRTYTTARDPLNGNDYSTPGISAFVGIRYQPK